MTSQFADIDLELALLAPPAPTLPPPGLRRGGILKGKNATKPGKPKSNSKPKSKKVTWADRPVYHQLVDDDSDGDERPLWRRMLCCIF